MVVSVGVTLAQHQMDVVNNSVAFTYVTPVQVTHTTHPVNTSPCQHTTLSIHPVNSLFDTHCQHTTLSTHCVNLVNTPCQYILSTHCVNLVNTSC